MQKDIRGSFVHCEFTQGNQETSTKVLFEV